MATVVSEVSVKALVNERPASGTVTGLGSREFKHLVDFATTYPSGTSNSQNDLVYSDTQTTSGTVTYDLLGSLTSQMDAVAVSFVEVCWIIIKAKHTSTSTLNIGAGSNPFAGMWMASGDGIKLGAGGVFVWGSPVNGVAPVASTGDILTVASSSGAIEYEILIIGRSA